MTGLLLAAALLTAGVDTDGMVVINGQRTFVVGLYAFPKTAADPWRAGREAGFNLVHVKATSEEVRKAAEYGYWAWVTTGTLNGKNEAPIRKTVEALRGEPALLFWEIEDEPTFVWKKPREVRTPAERMIVTRKFVQSLDSKHLFYLNHAPTNLVSTLRRYNDATDAMATDVYPVIPRGIRNQYALWPDGQQGDFLNETISQVGQYADKMRQVAGPGKPVLMVLQGFAWETIQKQPDPKMILYPTLEQARFMAYQSIVHGANGILYWGLHLGPADNPAWEAARAVAAELKGLAAELAARPVDRKLMFEYFDTGHSLDRGIAYTVRPSKDGAVVIAVNEDKNPVEVAIWNTGYRSCTIRARETFAPFEAKVYRCWN
jgi:hypothetical protein